MVDKQTSAKQAREFLRSETSGVLSTQSRVLEGYPFGSVVPFCLDADGYPVILISNLAQHTRNISKNSKVSLTVTQSYVDDVQTGARLTWVGDAEKITDAVSINRYYSFFPESCDYHKTHDFEFYRIVPVRSRYIGGFGDIHWLDNSLTAEANPFAGEVEESVISHMNLDHQEALQTYCCQFEIKVPEGVLPKMAGVDPFGFYVRVGKRIVRMTFSGTAKTAGDIRQFLVKMARAA
ncbi:pyridoxamine 5'-phosphate oxidase family protein [Sansalvadorimonas sp. 2012CJ34-2]|uniref:Pyridoxamine 5'-phosphate oxidase family protein n=1 Tax=Parendozoicomonas callyspongiae TaxID=2942213 RepID=A0ABT0PJ62_9GAMM|nr:DUF2470 domain-containing protein [Sansalvadorimonas sp. 2012CJ34-2]MCL6271398.1 pyridoxamine 5'-phosphate oxidase family protein [Sansalvadorimonas sp. 2012CJ34-2]